MSTMHPSSTDSIRNLGWLLASCVVVGVLLESGGLATWANRLEIGPLRQVAQPAMTRLDDTLHPLGIGQWRTRLLAGLERWQHTGTAPAPAASLPSTTQAPVLADSATVWQTIGMSRTGQALAITANPPSPTRPQATPATSTPVAKVILPTNLPSAATLEALPPIPSGQTRTVALVGDSMMAVGLSENLLRGIARHKELQAVRAFRSGTGLSRPEVFDWMQQYPQMLAGARPDAIIVAIGANDGQGFVQDGKVLDFGSDAWIAAYRQRLEQFVDMLSQNGTPIIWIGLPPMRLAKYDARMALINRIAYDTVGHRKNITWWNSATLIADPQGQYREYAQNAKGASIRLRAGDGIHLSDDGASLLAPPLLAWLDSPAPAATPPTTSVVASATPVTMTASP
ncbi:DUF459 domain-containing protein [Dyella sp.]|uniref:SGNH/GDSL hydrolase family protein n=1 Tax=Dyella sp. TaxID=1869338 RepID=UPI002ED4AEEA